MTDFRDPVFLRQHIKSTLDFYMPGIIDESGGYHQNFFDDGRPFAAHSKHLVSSCRQVINFCLGDRLFENQYRELRQRGVDFLRERHRRDDGGYVWTLSEDRIDHSNHCYGLAFVLLTYAQLVERGDSSALQSLYETWNVLESRFWQQEAGIYADEAAPDWSVLSDYRGQNANMHMCEACIAAFEATGDSEFLHRAQELAETVAVRLAQQSNGLIWEHYTLDLAIDWDYNRDDPANLYRPWGFQPGHQTEWAKLLLLLWEHTADAWLLTRAQQLFDYTWSIAWDQGSGGFFYGFDPDGNICDNHKYFWVQAESFAAAALLAKSTGDDGYWHIYETIWQYCWQCFVDHHYGGWFRILTHDNKKIDNQKSLAGAKCDYHNLGACGTVLDRIQQ